MTSPLTAIPCAALLLLVPPLTTAPPAGEGGADWPNWRGPDRDGISKESGWNVEGKKASVWEKNVGSGYSTVSIQGGRLYTMGHDEEKQQDTIWCLDAKTGAQKWAHTLPAKTMKSGHGGGTLSTPSADGEVVFASNREGNFFCFEAATGKIRWHKQLRDEYELKLPRWGFAAAPLVFDDMVVMNVGVVLAFDKKGELLWKTARSYGDAYSTPAELRLNGRSVLAVFAGDGLVLVDRARGEELAFHPWTTMYDINAATPVVAGERVFISSGYNHGCAMLAPTSKGLEVLWESKEMRNQMSGCVLFDGHLYGVDDATLKCLDLDGEVKWAQRGLGKGCLLLAGGRLLVMSDKGELVIASASPAGYEELSRRKVLDGGVCWTTPVLLDGLVYCRNSEGDLVCLDHR